MSTNTKPTKRLFTIAAAIGLALGTMGIAAAASPPAPTDEDQATVLDVDASEVEGAGDEAVDGIDYQFEGEEVGNNGDGIPDADEASEVEGAGDEAVDGIDHQFEGEEVGNNGDGIPDADDANEPSTDG